MNGSKNWYASKSLWVNAIALVALGAQSKFGFVIDVSTQGAILIVINMILRAITGKEVVFGSKKFTM